MTLLLTRGVRLKDVTSMDLPPKETQLNQVLSRNAATNPTKHFVRNRVFEIGVVPGGDATMIAGTQKDH